MPYGGKYVEKRKNIQAVFAYISHHGFLCKQSAAPGVFLREGVSARSSRQRKDGAGFSIS